MNGLQSTQRDPSGGRPQVATDERAHLAEAVREACLTAALDGYERAGLSGLCAEGRWELAIDALRTVDVRGVVERMRAGGLPAPEDVS